MGCCCKKKQKIETVLYPDENEEANEIVRESVNNTQLNEIKLKIKVDDFDIVKLIGKGTYGKVLLVKLKSKETYYAMKILNKKILKLKGQENNTKNERDLMIKISSPFIVNIKFAFQDDINLYLVSEFMQGGELFFHLRKNKYFTEELVRFYATELVLAISHIHEKNAVYRDLKPENILLDRDGHIKLTDLGLCKIIKENDSAYTICGTLQYIAPEILIKTGYKKEVDWWSLGCVVYQMLEGKSPFGFPRGQMTINFFKRPIKFYYTDSKEAKNFIKDLLAFKPEKRLGFGHKGIIDIKNHPFFKGIDWDKALRKEYKPPFIPELSDDLDLKYFDKEFTQDSADLNKIQSKKEKQKTKIDSNYLNFSYIDNEIQEDLLNNNDSEDKV